MIYGICSIKLNLNKTLFKIRISYHLITILWVPILEKHFFFLEQKRYFDITEFIVWNISKIYDIGLQWYCKLWFTKSYILVTQCSRTWLKIRSFYIKGLHHLVAKLKVLEFLSVWQKLNSFQTISIPERSFILM